MSGKSCEVCNKSLAMYVCRDCGKNVCRLCFDTYGWQCQVCSNLTPETNKVGETEQMFSGWPVGYTFFIAAFIMILAGMLLMIMTSLSSGAASGGLVIFIGPIPIALGVGPQSSLLITVAFALAIVMMIVFFLMNRRRSV